MIPSTTHLRPWWLAIAGAVVILGLLLDSTTGLVPAVAEDAAKTALYLPLALGDGAPQPASTANPTPTPRDTETATPAASTTPTATASLTASATAASTSSPASSPSPTPTPADPISTSTSTPPSTPTSTPAAACDAGTRAVEPFPPCTPDEVCTFLIYYSNRYDQGYRPTLRRFDYLIVNKNSYDSGAAADALSTQPVVLYEPLQYRLNFCNGGCAYEDWSTVDANEGWFWHDRLGNRVYDVTVPAAWFMDFRSSDYLGYLVRHFQDLKRELRPIDGFFADENGPYNGYSRYKVPRMRPDTIFPLPSEAQYDAFNIAAIRHVKSGIGKMHFILNSNNYGPFQCPADGSLDEDFVHNSGEDDERFRLEAEWRAKVDGLASSVHQGKFVFVMSASRTTAGLQRVLRYGLASYLMGKRSDAYTFYFHSTQGNMGQSPYYSEYDTVTGAPLGSHFRDSASGLYVRRFERGIAVVHTDSRRGNLSLRLTGDLAGTYVNWDGEAVTGSLTMGANTGQFLRRAGGGTDLSGRD